MLIRQVDIERRIARLEHAKNSSPRTVPLTTEATLVFTEALSTPCPRPPPPQDRVGILGEPGRDGIRHPYLVDKAWTDAKRAAGLEDFLLHDLRHEASSRFVQADLNDQEVSAISSLALTLAACGSAKDANKSNFSKTIQAYLDTQKGLCAAIPAKDLPFTLANQDMLGGQNKKRADALVDAGLLTKRDTEVKAMFGNKMEPATEYQITDTGKKFLVANGANTLAGQDAFCTGKYTVVEVDNFTEPSDMMGVKLSQVNYRYKVDGADDWAKSEGMRANYKNFAEQTQGDIQSKAAVILTNDGWMHERLFKHG